MKVENSKMNEPNKFVNLSQKDIFKSHRLDFRSSNKHVAL